MKYDHVFDKGIYKQLRSELYEYIKEGREKT